MRRVGTIFVILAVIVVGVFVERRVLGRSDDNATDDPSSWNTIAVLTGEGVSVVSRDGKAETVTYPLDDEPLDLQSEVVGGVLVTLADDGRIAQTDLGDGTAERPRLATTRRFGSLRQLVDSLFARNRAATSP